MANIKKQTAEKKTKVISAEMPVYDIKGVKTSEIKIPASILNADVNMRLLAQYERVYQANQRQGNASAKTRGEVSGSTKKIYRQKGTGNARHGSRKAPIFVGGGVVFGPLPHNFDLSLNKKQIQKSLAMALHVKQEEKALVGFVVEVMELKKTKEIANLLKKIKIARNTMLILPEVAAKEIVFAARNIPFVTIHSAHTVNAHDVMRSHFIIFVGDTLEKIAKRLA